MQIIKYCLPIAFVLSLAAAAPVDVSLFPFPRTSPPLELNILLSAFFSSLQRFLVEKRETFESEALARWFNDDTDTLARALTSRGLVVSDSKFTGCRRVVFGLTSTSLASFNTCRNLTSRS